MKTIVSVIVPVYNSEKYLRKCVESIINQTYSELDIILINDGSSDNSGAVCEEYAKKDKRITIIHKKNGGVSSARNVGLDQSIGDYIMFVDSDDWIEYNAINALIKIEHEDEPELIMFGSYHENLILNKNNKSFHDNQSFNSKNDIRDILPVLIREETINAVWNKIYQSNIIKDRNIRFDEKLFIAEDLLFNYQIFSNLKSLYITDRCYYHYMIRDSESLTKSYNPSKHQMLSFVTNYIQKDLIALNCPNKALQAIKHIRLKNVFSCLLDLFCEKNQLKVSEKRNYIEEIIEQESDEYQHYSDSKLFKALILVLSTRNISFIYLITYIMAKTRPHVLG